MKRFIVIITLFFLAIAVSPTLIGEKGYILIAMGDVTIESTVVTAAMMLLALFIVILLTLKVLNGGLRISLGAWHSLVFAKQRKGLRNFNKGVTSYILTDYKQAEELLVKSAEPSKLANIAYLLAASSADKQGLVSNTKHYLNQIKTSGKDISANGLDSVVITIQLMISHKSYDQARKLIDEHHKHIGHDDRLLGLDITLSLIEKRYAYVINQLVKARKSKTISSTDINSWETSAFLAQFTDKIENQSVNALHEYWQNLPRKVKQRECIVLAYCHVLAGHQISEPLTKILLPVIKKGTNKGFLIKMRTLPLTKTEPLIQAVQKHLHHDHQNPQWLSCLAHLAAHGEQWSMAEKAFNTLVHIDGAQYDKEDLLTFANVLIHQNENIKAIDVLQKASRL